MNLHLKKLKIRNKRKKALDNYLIESKNTKPVLEEGKDTSKCQI